MRILLVALALIAAPLARAESPAPPPSKAPAAPAAEVEHSAWEMDLFAGYGQLAFPAADMTNVAWSNGGPSFALSFAYRGPHFTHPFVDVSYVPILSSGRYVNVFAPGGSATVFAENSSYALGLVVGPGWDIDWFRVRVGVGLYDVVVKSNLGTGADTNNQITIGFLASLSAMVWRPEPFALGVEARMVALTFPTSGIYQSMWSVGVTGRWDFSRK